MSITLWILRLPTRITPTACYSIRCVDIICSEATNVTDKSSKNESSPAVGAATIRPATNRLVTKAFVNPPIVRKTPFGAKAVGSFVPRLTKKVMEKYGFSTAALLTDWATIVGADLARHTRPNKLKWPRAVEAYGETPAGQSGRPGATLHLMVDAARALDVQYKGRQIIDRINAYFGYRAIADLRIEQVPLTAEPRQQMPRDIISAKSRSGKPPVDLGQVADERLRAAFELIQKGMARR